MLFYLFKPPIYINEAVAISKVKDNQDSIGTLIVGFGNCAVSFLTCSIPDLESHCALVDLECSKAEVNSNGCNIILLKVIVL